MASVFKQLGQISMVVEDVMETAKIWNDEYGIGPWGFLHFTEENMTSMSVHGKNVPYAMDIALCNMYPNIEIELIAPKDDRSIYAEFLREHGPGIHRTERLMLLKKCLREKESNMRRAEKILWGRNLHIIICVSNWDAL